MTAVQTVSLLGALLLLPAAPPLPPVGEDTYHVLVFSGQRPCFNQPRYAHTWGTFVRRCSSGKVEHFTISWLPVDGRVRPFAPHPETGRNFSLEETLALCRENGMRVSLWGPYEICPELWTWALIQKGRLDSGAVLYKAYDFGSRDGTVSNCIHALGYFTREPGQHSPNVVVAPLNWGDSASYWIALTYRPWFPEPCRVHDWLLPVLGLNRCELTRRGLDRNPTHNPVARALQALVHHELLPNRVSCDP